MIHSIDGVTVATQTECKVEINTQSTEDSGRDLEGLMHNTFLPSKYKLFPIWPQQSFADRAVIVSAIVNATNPSQLSIVFDDPATGTTSTKTFMMGTPMSMQELVSPVSWWDKMSIDFIEV
jgi:hypothetical protein